MNFTPSLYTLQGTYNGNPALGTVGGWTTNDPAHTLYFDQNTKGPDYWAIDIMMDCSQTESNWFEFTAVLTDGSKLLI